MFYILTPWLVILFFLLGLVFLLFRRWKVGAILWIIAIGLNVYTEAVPVNLFSTNEEGELKVMCYNIHSSSESFKGDTAIVDNMAQIILRENPDVLTIEEYYVEYCGRFDSLLRKNYSYSEVLSKGTPNVVYSKYPLSDKMELFLDSASIMNEGLEQAAKLDSNRTTESERLVLGVTVNKRKRKLRVIACHLASNQYDITRRNMSDTIEWWKGIPEYRLSFQSGSLARETEIQYTQKEIEKYKKQGMPVIVCGDMNDVSGSKTLRMLQSAGLKNAWWEKGRGFGFTYHGHHFMNFRIDHILHTADIKVKSIKKIDQHYSDHDPVIASFDWM